MSFNNFTDSQTVDLKEITIEEEEFSNSPISVSDILMFTHCFME